MHQSRSISGAALCAAAILGTAVAAGPAQAGPAAGTATVTSYDGSALVPATAVTGTLRAKADVATADYLQDGARRGRNLDARRVGTYLDPSSAAIVTVSADRTIDGVDIGRVGTVARAFGIRSHDSGAPAATAGVPVVGFAGAPSTSGYTLVSSGAHQVTASDDADIVIGGTTSYLRSSYWKYQLPESREAAAFSSSIRSGSDFWVYARRGEADAGTSGYPTDDLTVRARPWGGTSGNFRSMLDRRPTGAQSCGSVAITTGGTVSLPVTTCSGVSAVASTGSALEFGADYNGSSTGRVGVEALALYRVTEGYAPSFADYVWGSFGSRDVKWADTGW